MTDTENCSGHGMFSGYLFPLTLGMLCREPIVTAPYCKPRVEMQANKNTSEMLMYHTVHTLVSERRCVHHTPLFVSP